MGLRSIVCVFPALSASHISASLLLGTTSAKATHCQTSSQNAKSLSTPFADFSPRRGLTQIETIGSIDALLIIGNSLSVSNITNYDL